MARWFRKIDLPARFVVDIVLVTFLTFLCAVSTLFLKNMYPVWSSPIWPASGVALAFVLLRGPWMLLGVYLGLVPTQFFFWGTESATLAIFAPLGNVAETFLAWFLLRKAFPNFNDQLKRTRDLGIFLLLAPWAPSIVSALLVQTLLQSLSILSPDRFFGEVLIYAFGNASGILLLTPLILVWRNPLSFPWKSQAGINLISFIALFIVILVLQRMGTLSTAGTMILLVPLTILSSWSSGLKGATIFCLLLFTLFFSLRSTIVRPLPILVAEKQLESLNALHPERGGKEAEQNNPPLFPKSNNLPPSITETLSNQVSTLGFLFLTLLPLGAAADELRGTFQRDRRAMRILNSSFWEWTLANGSIIENETIAQKIDPEAKLFQSSESKGALPVPPKDPLGNGYLSHWVITESNAKGEAVAAVGFLQSLQTEEKLQKAESLARMANLEAQTLRAHLNPHLLFNCLTGLRALIESDPTRAREFTGHLARFLRSAVDSQNLSSIPLEAEIAICRDFLSLETMRGKKVHLQISVPPDAMQVYVPPLSVQVLVENACKHGTTHEVDGLPIQISSRWDSLHRLCLTVSQPGTLSSAPREREHEGLGLLRRQLESVFGQKAFFSLSQTTNLQVEAKLILPTKGSS